MSIFSLRRFEYNYKHIKQFRNNIRTHIIPLVNKTRDMQRSELELDTLEYYDTAFYKEAPQLLYTDEKLLVKMKDIFNLVNSDLGSFYGEMLENNYIDLLNRDHKINFAITNYLTLDATPVITGNFKNKYNDLTTLSHEFGHAFQKYIAGIEDEKHVVSPLLKYPTFDIAEIFSYAMQLIILGYVKELFTDEDYNKFIFLTMKDLISTLPYICAIDEFQEQIYSKQNITIEEIRKNWLNLCEIYDLKINNSGHPNLENGGYFYRQNHIFLNPFYYIDYAISYFGAFALWQKSTNNLDLFKQMAAVASYYPLNELVNRFDIANPFNEESVKQLSLFLKNKLNEFKEK